MMATAKKVLVIDDDTAFAEMVADTLRSLGYVSEVVNDTCRMGAILHKIDEFDPDLITLDMCLPGTDGFSVLVNLLEDRHTRGLPVFVVTGWYDHIPRNLLPRNVQEVFRKPLGMNYFTQKVKTCLNFA